MLCIVKLLCSEVPEGVSGTPSFTLCKHNTSQRHRCGFTWRSQTSLNVAFYHALWYFEYKGDTFMKDKRIDKITQHYDIYINDRKYKVLSCSICEQEHKLSVKTKIRGQDFPRYGHFTITIPAENISQDFCISFQSMGSNTAIEHWEYTILPE